MSGDHHARQRTQSYEPTKLKTKAPAPTPPATRAGAYAESVEVAQQRAIVRSADATAKTYARIENEIAARHKDTTSQAEHLHTSTRASADDQYKRDMDSAEIGFREAMANFKPIHSGLMVLIILGMIAATAGIAAVVSQTVKPTDRSNAVALVIIGAMFVFGIGLWILYALRKSRGENAIARKRDAGKDSARDIWTGRVAKADQEFAAAKQEAHGEMQRANAVNVEALEEYLKALRVSCTAHTAQADAHSAPWNGEHWKQKNWKGDHYHPATTIPATTRLGTLYRQCVTGRADFAALVPLLNGQSMLFEADAASCPTAIGAMQSLAMRLLATVPPKRLLFTFVDPDGVGQNSAPFMALRDADDALVTRDTWINERDINEQLGELKQRIGFVNALLGDPNKTIERYNEEAGAIAEPYRLLVAFDFPDSALTDLELIARQGPRCGVYALILRNTSKPEPYGFSLDPLRQSCLRFTTHGDHLTWEDDDFRDCTLMPDTLPESAIYAPIVAAIGKAAQEDKGVVVPFARIAPPPEAWWQSRADTALRVPLGPRGVRVIEDLVLDEEETAHALVIGQTGSGKTTLFHTIITNIALRYRPDDVELYLMDLKQGIGFKVYTADEQRRPRPLPHARVIAIESEREYALSVLQRLDKELGDRGVLFRAAGVEKLSQYRAKTGKPLTRILALIDEFQELFVGDDQIAAQATIILERIARQGRASGVHLMLGSQTLRGAHSLPNAAIGQIAVRIALRCNADDARLIFADDNLEPQTLSRQGEAIYNPDGGLKGSNRRFQVAYMTPEQQHTYLDAVQAKASGEQYAAEQRIFEGNAPAEIGRNDDLAAVVTRGVDPANARKTLAWLGEPIAIREAVAATFRREGTNLLIIGQNSDDTVLGLFATALVSIAAQLPPLARATPQIAVLDFGTDESPHADALQALTARLPHATAHGRRRQLPEIIGAYADEVQRRLDADDDRAPAMYLFVYGLHRARDLREEEGGGFGFSSPFSEEPPAPSLPKQFATILREGPNVGVHTVIWCDTMTNLGRTLDRRTLREFAMRVAFQMSAEDSANLIDTPAANKLGHYRALFYDEDAGRVEKFRPYGLPDAAWLDGALARIVQRAGASV